MTTKLEGAPKLKRGARKKLMEVVSMIEKKPKQFCMRSWHETVAEFHDGEALPVAIAKHCGTTHCIAGWWQTLYGETQLLGRKKVYVRDANDEFRIGLGTGIYETLNLTDACWPTQFNPDDVKSVRPRVEHWLRTGE